MLNAWIFGTDVVASLNITYHTEVGVLKWPNSIVEEYL
jgi:hypothetical protein